MKLTYPKGVCLVSSKDGGVERFVEDVSHIDVCQVGRPVGAHKKKGDDLWVEAPRLVLPGDKTMTISKGLLRRLQRYGGTGCIVGRGKGFHGFETWQGVGLRSVIERVMGKTNDYRSMAILVSASDGYRTLFSGGEVAYAPLGESLILVDREDDKPLERNKGRYRIIQRLDLFVDRSIHSIEEIRVMDLRTVGARSSTAINRDRQ